MIIINYIYICTNKILYVINYIIIQLSNFKYLCKNKIYDALSDCITQIIMCTSVLTTNYFCRHVLMYYIRNVYYIGVF